MSEISGYTPGPWHISYSQNEGIGILIKPIPGQVVAECDNLPNMLQNAYLIAAAPELLDALRDMMTWFAQLEDWSGVGDPNIEKCRAAINKAIGKQ